MLLLLHHYKQYPRLDQIMLTLSLNKFTLLICRSCPARNSLKLNVFLQKSGHFTNFSPRINILGPLPNTCNQSMSTAGESSRNYERAEAEGSTCNNVLWGALKGGPGSNQVRMPILPGCRPGDFRYSGWDLWTDRCWGGKRFSSSHVSVLNFFFKLHLLLPGGAPKRPNVVLEIPIWRHIHSLSSPRRYGALGSATAVAVLHLAALFACKVDLFEEWILGRKKGH